MRREAFLVGCMLHVPFVIYVLALALNLSQLRLNAAGQVVDFILVHRQPLVTPGIFGNRLLVPGQNVRRW